MTIKHYNQKYPLDSYYQHVEYYGRSKICFITDDLNIVSEKVNKGWSFCKTNKGFYLEAPEQWIVDISEPAKITYFTNNPINNYAYFLYIKSKTTKELVEIIETVSNSKNEFFVSKGKSLETEVRIIIGDKKEGKKIASDLYSYFLQDPKYNKFIKQSKKFLVKTRSLDIEKNQKISDYPYKINKFFLEIKDLYSMINLEKRPLYSHDFIPGLNTQIESLFKSADYFVFVPWGCFKYIGNFITEKTVDKIILWELHMSQYKTHQHKFRFHDLHHKNVVILDKSYTGGTLNKIAALIKEKGGIPIKVALFPKSRNAVKNSDYTVFIDKIIPSESINTSNEKWYSKLYKQILKV